MEHKFKIKLPFMKNSRAAKASMAAHHTRLGKDPYFDWTVILGIFVATMVLTVSFGFALWHEVRQESFGGSTISGAPTLVQPSLNSVALQQILIVQSDKASAAAQYEKGYSGPPDPSM